jgi:DNA polymerase III delta prime subunit
MASCLVNKNIDSDEIKKILKTHDKNISPYILLIEKIWMEDKKRYKNKIYREDLTYINDFFVTKDDHWQKRVCVINAIDDLSNDGVNSLLKITEEPNPNSHFIIINHNQKTLTPTIRSRSQIIKFKSTKNEDFKSAIKQEFTDLTDNEINDLFKLSKGSIDFSRKYIDYNFREMDDHLDSILIDPNNIKPNTADHYINFVKNNIDSNDDMETFFKFIALKINKLSIRACAENNKILLDRLLKNYYTILSIKKKYLTFNLNFEHTIIAYFYLVKNV